MHICAFHVDRCGILRQVSVEGLPAGLAIFVGHNEAGKSTCLDFFRAMLTGYPRRATGREQGGGSLHLHTAQGEVRLSRRPGPNGGVLSLTDAAGELLDVALLDRLMGGVTREVYRNVYGFSLSELQTFDSLDTKNVRDALYGASFGMGLRSPGAALRRLESNMEALFKPKGAAQPVSMALREWDEVARQIHHVEDEAARYDELAAALQQAESSVEQLRRGCDAWRQELRELERRSGVWRQWDEWRLAGARLDRLEAVALTFPADGLARLERALDRQDESSRHCRLLQERMERTAEQRAELHINEAVLELTQTLRTLAERKASCYNALGEIPRLHAALCRGEMDLAEQLSILGPDWSTERIRAVDRSLFVREEMERQAQDMHGAEAAYGAAMAAMDKAAREADEARRTAEQASVVLANLPMPVADLDESTRERLRKNLAHTEDAQQRLPERIKAHAVARADYNRALSHLHLRPVEGSVQVLDTLAEKQDEALQRVQDVLTGLHEENNTRILLDQAREAEKQGRQRMTRLQNERDEHGVPTRASIEARRNALRRLRKTAGELALEQNRAAEVQAGLDAHLGALPTAAPQHALAWSGVVLCLLGVLVLALHWQWGLTSIALAEDVLVPLSNWLGVVFVGSGAVCTVVAQTREAQRRVLLGVGATLMAMGGGAIAARRMFGMRELVMASGQTVPLEMWSGYMVLLMGVVCMALAMGRKKPEASPQALLTEQLRERSQAAQARVHAVEATMLALCEEVGLARAEPEAMDALEAHLDEEREKWATNERMDQEMSGHAREVADLHTRAVELENACATRHLHMQTLQRKWNEYMAELGVQQVPVPEGAQIFFGRVDGARMAWAGVQALENEMGAMEACGVELMRLARELLPAKVQPANWINLMDVMDVVRRVLESCREADRAAEARARATEALRGAQAMVERTSTVQIEAAETARQAETRLKAARKAWRDSLAGMGLGLELSPATTREALECMDRCLGLESEMDRLRGELERQIHERDALVEPLRGLLEGLQRTPDKGIDGEADWLASLDVLQQEVEDNRHRAEARSRLELIHEEQRQDLRSAKASDDDAYAAVQALLQLAQVEDVEAFRHKDAVRLERESLIRRREDLEDALRLATDTTPLQEFLDQFAELNKDELDARAQELAAQLYAASAQEQELADSAGTLRAQLTTLSSADTVASLRTDKAMCESALRETARDWARHAMARHLLVEARRRFEKERQPDVIRSASTLFADITDGAWTHINASLEDGALQVLPAHGDPMSPEQLSRGAQEQLYLALRLAHIRHHAALAAPLPVIMDDILVNFDPTRAARTAQALVGLTRDTPEGPGHQILYFTCHPHMAECLHNALPESVVYQVENGTIRLQQ